MTKKIIMRTSLRNLFSKEIFIFLKKLVFFGKIGVSWKNIVSKLTIMKANDWSINHAKYNKTCQQSR